MAEPKKCTKQPVRPKAGRIGVAGMEREVTFDPMSGNLNEQIDEAYRAKYCERSWATSRPD